MKHFVTELKRARHSNGHYFAWFYEELYRANIHLIWPVNNAQMAAYLKYEFGIDAPAWEVEPNGRCIELVSDLSRGSHVICLREFAWNAEWTSILAHEAFHATEQILDARGMKHTIDHTSETYAYLLESIINRCSRLLCPATEKLFKKQRAKFERRKV